MIRRMLYLLRAARGDFAFRELEVQAAALAKLTAPEPVPPIDTLRLIAHMDMSAGCPACRGWGPLTPEIERFHKPGCPVIIARNAVNAYDAKHHPRRTTRFP